MSTLVITQLFARPGRGGDVADRLLEILGESLEHEDARRSAFRDQDYPDHVAGLAHGPSSTASIPDVAHGTRLHGHLRGHAPQPLVNQLLRQLYAGEGIAAGSPAP